MPQTATHAEYCRLKSDLDAVTLVCREDLHVGYAPTCRQSWHSDPGLLQNFSCVVDWCCGLRGHPCPQQCRLVRVLRIHHEDRRPWCSFCVANLEHTSSVVSDPAGQSERRLRPLDGRAAQPGAKQSCACRWAASSRCNEGRAGLPAKASRHVLHPHVGHDAGRSVGMTCEVVLNLDPPCGLELAVDEGVEVGLGDWSAICSSHDAEIGAAGALRLLRD